MAHPPLYISVPETGELLGLSRNTVYSLVRAGVIPHIRFGKSIRVPVAALESVADNLARAAQQSTMDIASNVTGPKRTRG